MNTAINFEVFGVMFCRKKNSKSLLKYGLTFIFLFLYGLLFSTKAQLSQLKFESLTVNDGLSQNSVICVFQDTKGFLWFGTYDGLNRYDGYEFKVFKPDPADSFSISSNSISSICEDKSGFLWIGTFGEGLNKYDPSTDKFIWYKNIQGNENSLNDNFIYNLIMDTSGTIWIGSWNLGVCKFDPHKNIFTQYPVIPDSLGYIGNGKITDIKIDGNNRVWIATSRGGIYLYDDVKDNFIPFEIVVGKQNSLPTNRIYSLNFDDSDNLWIGTIGQGVFKYILSENKLNKIPISPINNIPLKRKYIISVFLDHLKQTWLATTEDGLFKLDIPGNVFVNVSNNSEECGVFKTQRLRKIFEDKSGVLWIASWDGGIYKHIVERKKFIHFHKEIYDPNSISVQSVYSILEDDKGILWIAGAEGGLNKLDRKNKTITKYNLETGNLLGIDGDLIASIRQDENGFLWFISSTGLSRFDPVSEKCKTYRPDRSNPNSLSSGIIRALCIDHTGKIWVGNTGSGINVLDPTTGNISHFVHDPNNSNSLGDNEVHNIYESVFEPGVMWIATTTGLNRFETSKDKWTWFAQDPKDPGSLSFAFTFPVMEDHNGTLWVGTGGGGLNKFNRKTEKFDHYTTKDGLANDAVYGILEDDRGFLWISTNRGISKFDPVNITFRNFTEKDGLQSNEFNGGAAFKSKSGEMFFGGVNGFNAFFPDSIKDDRVKPNVVLTDFQIFNKSIAPGKQFNGRIVLRETIQSSSEITLSYEDYVITLVYAALHYVSPPDNRYAYMLEGLEQDWNYVGNRRFATYSNLSPGNYTFKVKAANPDGIWNDKITSIKLIVTPPYWETWWFRTIIIVLIAAIIFLAVEFRIYNLRKKENELKKIVAEKTHNLAVTNRELESFSYSVSHDLRAPLRAIKGFSDILQEDYTKQLDKEGKRYLSIISDNIEKMRNLIDDLLAFSKLGRQEMGLVNINMKKLIEEICQELKSDNKNKEVQFVLGDILPIKGDRSMIRQVWINLISNAIKFRKTGLICTIEIGSRADQDNVTYFVKDNGIGFNMEYYHKLFGVFQRLHSSDEFEGSGVGLALVQRIIHRHGGSVWAESEINKGSTFYFALPISKNATAVD